MTLLGSDRRARVFSRLGHRVGLRSVAVGRTLERVTPPGMVLPRNPTYGG